MNEYSVIFTGAPTRSFRWGGGGDGVRDGNLTYPQNPFSPRISATSFFKIAQIDIFQTLKKNKMQK